MTHRLVPPFSPRYPRENRDTQDFAHDVGEFLNNPLRNEFTIPVHLGDAMDPLLPYLPMSVGLIGGSTTVEVAGVANNTILTGASFVVDTLHAMAFIPGSAYPVTALGAQVATTVGTSPKFRVGIYDAVDDRGGDFTPNVLIVESGELDGQTAGVVRNSNINKQLNPGRLYFAAFLAYAAAPTMNRIPAGGSNILLGTNNGAFTSEYTVAYTTGSSGLPATFPTGFARAATTPPAVYITYGAPTSDESRVSHRCSVSPYLDGLVVRRTRIVKSSELLRSNDTTASVLVRALIMGENGEIEVGKIDTAQESIAAHLPRVISGSHTLEKKIPVGGVLEAEVTQRGWPKTSMADATVLFDIGLRT